AAVGVVTHLAYQLSTRGTDVIGPGGPYSDSVACFLQDLPKVGDRRATGPAIIRQRKGIEGYQVDLAGEIPQQHSQVAGVLAMVVDAGNQRVLNDRHALVTKACHVAAGTGQQLLNRILAVDWYQLVEIGRASCRERVWVAGGGV